MALPLKRFNLKRFLKEFSTICRDCRLHQYNMKEFKTKLLCTIVGYFIKPFSWKSFVKEFYTIFKTKLLITIKKTRKNQSQSLDGHHGSCAGIVLALYQQMQHSHGSDVLAGVPIHGIGDFILLHRRSNVSLVILLAGLLSLLQS